jgi:acetoacetyl-CoA synthetase
MFAPSEAVVARSQMTDFKTFFAQQLGVPIRSERDLNRLSVERWEEFWSAVLVWSGIRYEGDPSVVCDGQDVESARFFPGVRLSYTESLLGRGVWPAESAAVTALNCDGGRERITRGELAGRVDALAALLREVGVGQADRVVALLGNKIEAVAAALAAASLGAAFSSAAPDMGAPAVLSRFSHLDPAVLMVGVETSAVPRERVRERVAAIAAGLPSLRCVVVLNGDAGEPLAMPVHRFADASTDGETRRHELFGFNHPLFVMFSSGTTGPPKCIVHGAGGTLLEHVKEHRLHGDLRPGEKLFFHTSTAWMMWNWQLSALACGAEIVLYDGPSPEPSTLWEIVAREGVNIFGTSPPYLRLGAEAGYSPAKSVDLTALRCVMSTGSILSDSQFDWIAENVGRLPVQSISGGTDIIGCFVLGNPNLPVLRGTSQCRSLGLAVDALGDRFTSSGGSRTGELVCRNPFPSRPLGLVGDSDGTRFHAAYFDQNAGMWTHGDFIELFDDGSVRMLGRSDGVLNVRGIRIGPAEIYSVLQGFDQIAEAMVVEQRTGPDESRVVLLVVPRNGHHLDRDLERRIRSALAHDASPNHVPAVILEVAELPATFSGKRSEAAVRDMLNGEPVRNLEALRNPESLQAIVAPVGALPVAAAAATADVEGQLSAIWESLLGIIDVDIDDNFFELGGTSLQAARLFRWIAEVFEQVLPLSTLIEAPTIRALAQVVRNAPLLSGCAVELRPGYGGTILLIPGVHGNVLTVRALAAGLGGPQAIYGLQAPGLAPGQRPCVSVEEIAKHHLTEVQDLQFDRPYTIVGHSFGGLVAFEMARRLSALGEPPAFVGLVDPQLPLSDLRLSELALLVLNGRHVPQLAINHWNRLRRRRESGDHVDRRWSVRGPSSAALRLYRPEPYYGSVVYFEAGNPPIRRSRRAWRRLVRGGITFVTVPGNHMSVLRSPYVDELTAAIDERLQETQRRS